MNSSPVDLRRVHWYEGLFLKPEHFLRQDAFAESLAIWALRHGSQAFGLLGGGPRTAASADAFSADNLDVEEIAGSVALTVRGVRGITAGGAWIDVAEVKGVVSEPDAANPLPVYLVRRRAPSGFEWCSPEVPPDSDAVVVTDAACVLTTRPDADDVAWAVVVGRIRRDGEKKVVKDDTFLPVCIHRSSHRQVAKRIAEVGMLLRGLEGQLETLFVRAREIVALARGAAILLAGHFDDIAYLAGGLAEDAGDLAQAAEQPHLPVTAYLESLTRLVRRVERRLRMVPVLAQYLVRTEFTGDWQGLASRLGAPLHAAENLADRLDGADSICHALSLMTTRLVEACEDYRIHRRPMELELAVDSARKALYVREVGLVAAEYRSRGDLMFRFTGLSLSHERTYLVILFGGGDRPLADSAFGWEVVVNGRDQRGVVSAFERELPNQRNAGVVIPPAGEPIRSIEVRIPNAQPGKFTGAALYTLVTSETATGVRQESPRVQPAGPPPYVTLNVNKEDHEGQVELEGSNEVRVRLFYSRPEEQGGQGRRRMFEAFLVRDNAGWHCRLADRDSQDARIVSRWNQAEEITSLRAHHDFPTLPRVLDIGLADQTRGGRWFLRCQLRYSRTKDQVAARLEDVQPIWPTDERSAPRATRS